MDATERKDAAQERYDANYRAAYEAADEAAQELYAMQFGPKCRDQCPYRPNHKALHLEALRLLDQ